MSEPVLSVRNLNIKFDVRGRELHAIRDASLEVYPGERLAIVGESGSGKSVLARSFMGLLDTNGRVESGEIIYMGQDIAKYKTEEEWLRIRGREIAMVMQDPMSSLNPLMTVGDQILEALNLNENGFTRGEAKRKMYGLLEDVGVPDPQMRCRKYPHEFSGGMRQRIVIAIALARNPKILICDEPTTALDVTTQAQILKLIKDLVKQNNITAIYITHDLGVVANVAQRVAVMYCGDIIEVGTCQEIFHDPRHPYTWALLSSLPELGVKGEELYSIQGTPPDPFREIKGDSFAPRNPYALKIDFEQRPPFFEISPTHKARTWLLDPRAPRVEPPEIIRRLMNREVRVNV